MLEEVQKKRDRLERDLKSVQVYWVDVVRQSPGTFIGASLGMVVGLLSWG